MTDNFKPGICSLEQPVKFKLRDESAWLAACKRKEQLEQQGCEDRNTWLALAQVFHESGSKLCVMEKYCKRRAYRLKG